MRSTGADGHQVWQPLAGDADRRGWWHVHWLIAAFRHFGARKPADEWARIA